MEKQEAVDVFFLLEIQKEIRRMAFLEQ